jgi:hypothetical protein
VCRKTMVKGMLLSDPSGGTKVIIAVAATSPEPEEVAKKMHLVFGFGFLIFINGAEKQRMFKKADRDE